MNKDSKKIENLLSNINNKIKNRNIFAWKMLFGWLVAIPCYCIAGLLSAISMEYYPYQVNGGLMIVAILLGIAGTIWWLVNMILGIVALYKSTKDNK